MTEKRKINVYELVTERIIDQLKNGTVPWRKPWHVNTMSPRNIARPTKPYRGVNLLLTTMQGFSSPWWITRKELFKRGGRIKQGEHGTMVVYWNVKTFEDFDEKLGKKVKKTVPLLRYYLVWNLTQVEGVEAPDDSITEYTPPSIDEAERIIEGYKDGPKVSENGTSASYRPGTDSVTVPPRESFDTIDNFYATLFHELTHSTGSPDRLNRHTAKDQFVFASHSYGREELIAEMGSAFLAAEAGIENTQALSADYIGSWIEKIKEDPRAVVVAAGAAQKAADLILGRTNDNGGE